MSTRLGLILRVRAFPGVGTFWSGDLLAGAGGTGVTPLPRWEQRQRGATPLPAPTASLLLHWGGPSALVWSSDALIPEGILLGKSHEGDHFQALPPDYSLAPRLAPRPAAPSRQLRASRRLERRGCSSLQGEIALPLIKIGAHPWILCPPCEKLVGGMLWLALGTHPNFVFCHNECFITALRKGTEPVQVQPSRFLQAA